MTSLASWLTGKLSTSERIVTAVAPAVLLVLFVVAALVVYVVRNALRGRFHDEEMDHRGLGGLLGARARHFFAWLVRPFWRALAAAQVPPNAITTTIAFSNASRVIMSRGLISFSNRYRIACPARRHSSSLAGSSAGIEPLYGRLMPNASIADAIVLAVYMPPQAPAPGHERRTISRRSSSEICPDKYWP